jgi:hypothetical protein
VHRGNIIIKAYESDILWNREVKLLGGCEDAVCHLVSGRKNGGRAFFNWKFEKLDSTGTPAGR